MTIEHTEPSFNMVVNELKEIAGFFIDRGYKPKDALDLANDATKFRYNVDCLESFDLPGLTDITTAASALPEPEQPALPEYTAPIPAPAPALGLTQAKDSTVLQEGKLLEEEARKAEGLFMPTEIGKKFGLSATKVNRVITALGLQTKNKNSGHTLTEKGKQCGGTTRQYPECTVGARRIVWRENIFQLVAAELGRRSHEKH